VECLLWVAWVAWVEWVEWECKYPKLKSKFKNPIGSNTSGVFFFQKTTQLDYLYL
jgi:hypothetical protein